VERKERSMSSTAAAILFSLGLFTIGVLGVYFEVETVYCGVRVQELLADEAELLDEVRRLELRWNELTSPDVVEKWMELDAPLEDEFLEHRFPRPVPEPRGARPGRERLGMAEPPFEPSD
jgi:hypothetical protein